MNYVCAKCKTVLLPGHDCGNCGSFEAEEEPVQKSGQKSGQKTTLFSLGFSSMSFEGGIDMIKNFIQPDTIEEALDYAPGIPVLAAGVHIAHFWLTTLPLEKAEKSQYFLRLASKDPSFKTFEGEL